MEKAEPWLGDRRAEPPSLVSDLAFACLAFPPCGGNWSFGVGFQATLLAMSNAAGRDWKVTSAQGWGAPPEPPSCPSLPAANPDTGVLCTSPAWGSSWLRTYAVASLSHQARCPPGYMYVARTTAAKAAGRAWGGQRGGGAPCFARRGRSLPSGATAGPPDKQEELGLPGSVRAAHQQETFQPED